MSSLWKKEGQSDSHDWFHAFTTAEDRALDQRLVPYDVWTNAAHASVLFRSGILTDAELAKLRGALSSLLASGLTLAPEDEDVHSAVENRLTAELGDLGKKIHTARSRNDQVLTDLRLHAREQILSTSEALLGIVKVLIAIAEANQGVSFAGTTHTQPAMPSSVDAWALGYADGLLQTLSAAPSVYAAINRSPLGTAAGYGAPHFELDRGVAAELLAFDSVITPVAGAQLSRGLDDLRLADWLCYGLGTAHRVAADLIWMAHPAQGFIRLSDDQSSGSSIMPQKRNPDALELIRGSWHEATGYAHTIRSLSAGLISGYHRDLQLVKKASFALFDLNASVLNALERCLAGIRFDAESCANSITPEVMSTHHANQLVKGGMP
ncbi:MAG: hypothetical protein RL177_1577, partial [Bacteroidota bacterium]